MGNVEPLALFVMGFMGLLICLTLAAVSYPVQEYIDRKIKERRK